MLGPFATESRRTPKFYIAIHQVSLLSHAACASMSTTTTTTTTTRDRGDRYGPMEWAQSSRHANSLSGVVLDLEVFEGDAHLLGVGGGDEVVDAGGVVGVVARVTRRVERAVQRRPAAVDEVTAVTVARHRRRAGDRVV